MQRRYPHFRELMPLFGHDGDGTASDKEGEDRDEDTDQGPSDEDGYQPTKGAGSKRRSVPSPQDTSELPMSKRGKRKASTTQTRAKIPPTGRRTGVLGVRVQLGASPIDRLPWESEDGDDDYYGTNATQTENASPGRDVALKLAAIRLQEARTKPERLLLRHKMKREGISDEEINSAIPM